MLWQACRVHRVPTLGSYISIFLSVDAVDERCVCSVYPIWGHQSYMYREGWPFYKIFAVIFGFQSTTVNAELFFLMLQQWPLCSNFGVCMNFFLTVLKLVASLPCAPCTLFGKLYINFSQCWRSIRALHVQRVPHLGTIIFMYRKVWTYYKIRAVILRLSI